MKQKQLRAAQRYVEALQSDLNLEEWTLTVEITYDEEVHAQFHSAPGRREGNVAVHHRLHIEKPKLIHEVLIHELVHAMTRDLRGCVKDVLVPCLSSQEQGMVEAVVYFSEELLVDHMARTLANHIPIKKDLMRRFRCQT